MATMTHRTRTADRVRHEKLEEMLGLQEAALRNRKHALRESQPSGVLDVEERSMDAEEQGVGFWLLGLASQTVQGIEAALHRLEGGLLGTCSECGSRIPGMRLRALPFAALCLACQEMHDLSPMAVASRATAGWNEHAA